MNLSDAGHIPRPSSIAQTKAPRTSRIRSRWVVGDRKRGEHVCGTGVNRARLGDHISPRRRHASIPLPIARVSDDDMLRAQPPNWKRKMLNWKALHPLQVILTSTTFCQDRLSRRRPGSAQGGTANQRLSFLSLLAIWQNSHAASSPTLSPCTFHPTRNLASSSASSSSSSKPRSDRNPRSAGSQAQARKQSETQKLKKGAGGVGVKTPRHVFSHCPPPESKIQKRAAQRHSEIGFGVCGGGGGRGALTIVVRQYGKTPKVPCL